MDLCPNNKLKSHLNPESAFLFITGDEVPIIRASLRVIA